MWPPHPSAPPPPFLLLLFTLVKTAEFNSFQWNFKSQKLFRSTKNTVRENAATNQNSKSQFYKYIYFLTSQSLEIMNFPNCVSDGDRIFLCLLLWIVAGSAWLKLSCQSSKWETGAEVQENGDGGAKQEMGKHWKERDGGKRCRKGENFQMSTWEMK